MSEKNIRDHYFVAFLLLKGKRISGFDGKVFRVGISEQEYPVLLNEYRQSVSPVCKLSRQLVKHIQTYTSNPQEVENAVKNLMNNK